MEPTLVQPQIQTVVESATKISIIKIIKAACSRIWFHKRPLIWVTIITAISLGVVYILGMLALIASVGSSVEKVFQQIVFGLLSTGGFKFSLAPQGVVQTTLFSITMLVMLFLIGYLISRLLTSSVRALTSTEKMTAWTAYKAGGQGVWKVFGLLVLMGLTLQFATLFFIIPGIVYATALSAALFFVVIEQQGIRQAIVSSLKITRGNRFRIFVLGLTVAVLSILLSIVCVICFTILSKILDVAGTETIATLFKYLGMFVIPVFIFMVQYVYIIAVLNSAYAELKQLPVDDKSARVWLMVLFAILGLCIYILMLVVIPFATRGSIEKAREAAVKAQQIQRELEAELEAANQEGLTPYEKELQALFGKDIATIGGGKTGEGEVIGMGLNLNYPNGWLNVGPGTKGGIFMQFLRMTQAFGTPSPEKVGDLFKGGVKFAYKYDKNSVYITGYEFLKKYAIPKLEQEKKEGNITRFSVTSYPGKRDVGVLESEWSQVSATDGKTSVGVRERYYYWFVGPHRYTIHALDDVKDFTETDKAARVMINSLEFDDLITKYATEGR